MLAVFALLAVGFCTTYALPAGSVREQVLVEPSNIAVALVPEDVQNENSPVVVRGERSPAPSLFVVDLFGLGDIKSHHHHHHGHGDGYYGYGGYGGYPSGGSGGSYAESSASAGSYGGGNGGYGGYGGGASSQSQANSQAASFGVGPFQASFSSSNAGSSSYAGHGRRPGYFDYKK